MSTAIQWTDETWNVVTGCDRVSPGCDNCYIERTFPFRKEGRRFDERGRMGVRLHPDRLDWPLHWRKPRRVFVNSLSDLFHPDVPDDYIERTFGVMALAEAHTFQVLTKRPQRMARLLTSWLGNHWSNDRTWPLPNVWLGVSIENQRYADLRIPHLLDTPASVRFLSCEPLLGPVDLRPFLRRINDEARAASEYEWTRDRIDWVIVGGESGPGARPMEIAWAEGVVSECERWGAAPFVKQLGTVLGGKDHHDIDSFPESLRVRSFPEREEVSA